MNGCFLLRLSLAISISMVAPFVPAFACVQSFPEWHRGPIFTVVLTTYGKPLAGVPVRLELKDDNQGSPLIKVSDANGNVFFQNVRPGSYYVQVSYLGIEVGPGTVVVGRRGESSPITVEWPLRSRYVVAALSGRFQGYAYPEDEGPMLALVKRKPAPLALATLTLARVGSGAIVGITITGSDGSFAFPGLAPGLYVLHIRQSDDSKFKHFLIDDHLAIEIDPGSEREYLELQLGWSSCGMMSTKIEN